ncbi:hypothetical protein GCM10023208_17880 [Erythrobacter westpacificensis]|uniref:2-hydroxyacyl-CoA dehydratase n=1 Tax=Erythrobacter westpacificensis TaxID=1055231 RepID=A0ABP9KDP6_9SPHN
MIAIAGPNLPIDLLAATGRFRGVLAFEPDRATPRASGWLESKFAPWARPLLETWAEGKYDDLDHVLFSRADDTSQRLYYYICELQRRGQLGGPQPLILDVCKIPRDTSRRRTVAKLRELADRLGVDSSALGEAIARTNEEKRSSTDKGGSPVCLLAGTPPPDGRLHEVIEAEGFAPAGSTLTQEWLDPGPLVDGDNRDPFAALGEQLHTRPRGPRSFADAESLLAKSLHTSQASAAILWRIEEDEAQCWHLPAEREALEAAGIPSLVMTRRDWLANDGAREEIAAFLEGVTR